MASSKGPRPHFFWYGLWIGGLGSILGLLVTLKIIGINHIDAVKRTDGKRITVKSQSYKDNEMGGLIGGLALGNAILMPLLFAGIPTLIRHIIEAA